MNASGQIVTGTRSFRIVTELDALQAEVDALKHRQAGSRRGLHGPLDGLLPATRARACKGEM